jgi:molybdate transport system ATP-binding protein
VIDVSLEKALPGFTLSVAWAAHARVVALFGASGAGKSVTLQCLAGLQRPDRGRIIVDGETYVDRELGVDVPARARRVGYVFQGYALFPHLTVAENLAYGLAGRPRARRAQRVAELIERLGLRGLADKRPATLSGGQQQRVALGRAIAPEPRLLLLDEPLSALDAPLRRQLRDDLATVLRDLPMTTVLVTHDVAEAFHLADHIVVYDGGRVVQQSPKAELLSRPSSRHVARLLGVRNILDATVREVGETTVTLDWMGHAIIAAHAAHHPASAPGAPIAFFVRPEYIRLVRKDRPAGELARRTNLLAGTVVEEIDSGTTYTLRFAADAAPGEAAPPLLEIDIPKLAHEMLGVARERRWEVAIQPSAVQLLPRGQAARD